MTQRLKWSHIYSALSLSLWHMFLPRSDTALHNNVKNGSHIRMQTRKPCNNEGKKKPTKNSTITAAITLSIGPPLYISHLINVPLRMQPRVGSLNCMQTSSCTCISEHKPPWRNMGLSASYMFLISTTGAETTYDTHVWERTISSPTSL